MVHCTGIAGSVGCSMGQVNSGDGGACRHAPNGVPIQKLFTETSAYPCFAGKKCCLLVTAVPSVHAIYVETLGPMKR